MKVLQIITSLQTGGAEKLLVDIVPRLNQKGIMCDILTLIDEETPFKQELEKKNVKVFGLSKTMSVYDPRFIFKIKPWLKQYDIIHTHLFQPQYWTGIAKALFSPKTHLITTEHNTTNRRRRIKIYKLIDRFIYGQYDKIISISEATMQKLIEYIGMQEKMILISNGIDVNHFKNAVPVERKLLNNKLNEEDFIVTMVAGFREQKDQDTLIKALPDLPQSVKLIFAGDGIRRKYCEQLAENIGVKERVFFLGIRNDVANILKSSNVVAMSSHWEGFGLSAVEGMAAGKPVIVSNVEGLADIAKGAGLLLPPGNAKELAKVILRLKEDKQFAEKIANACYERAKKYDIEKTVEKLMQVYNSVLSINA
jgi:glycosyltransferase involved in cell wall biosynthesis